MCEKYVDVSAFLNFVSLDNFSDYCLSYTFTARDFADGTLGLAWVAKLTGSVGGVCERRQLLQNIQKSLNSGIVTVINYQARVPEAAAAGSVVGQDLCPRRECCVITYGN